MALYAIGDLHLSIQGTRPARLFRRKHYILYKPMEVFDPVWKDHADKLEKAWKRMITQEDTVVITGDHSWGKDLEECMPDFNYMASLPGKKILLRGNHDLFWDVRKTYQLNDTFQGVFSFLQNNYYSYADIALVGTKGCCYEGKGTWEHFEQTRDKEAERLRMSLEEARNAGFRRFLMFLHYPPTSVGEKESCFTNIAKEFGVEKVIYSHCHGEKKYYDSFHGKVDGIEYRLVSSDFLRFEPSRLL